MSESIAVHQIHKTQHNKLPGRTAYRYRRVIGVLLCSLFVSIFSLAQAQEADPMRPASHTTEDAQPSAPTGWTLSSILISDQRRLAVINGELLRVGGRVDGARVVRIDVDGVVIRHGGGEQTLTMKSELAISRSGGQ